MGTRAWLLIAGMAALVVAACGGVARETNESNASLGGAGTSAGSGAHAGTTRSGAAGSLAASAGAPSSIGVGGTSVGGVGGISSTAAAGAPNDADVPPCVLSVFARTCSGSICHSAANSLAADPDLASPGLASRLVDQPAQFFGLEEPGSCPIGSKLIDTTNRSASWLLKKIQNDQGTCGSPMPSIGALTATDKSCLVNWIDTVPPLTN